MTAPDVPYEMKCEQENKAHQAAFPCLFSQWLHQSLSQGSGSERSLKAISKALGFHLGLELSGLDNEGDKKGQNITVVLIW